ncbi:MAG: glycoside hydrolase family 16 protein [Gammaproteobacteria bacterium]
MKFIALIITFFIGLSGCALTGSEQRGHWHIDFLDDFETFNNNNWQDQLLWVNNEDQCYVPDNQFGTREVSNGTLKLKVVDIGAPRNCDNMDKYGKKHPDTRYMAGRIASKNRQEFIQGKWTARLRTWGNGQSGMFPAWWLLGARNNEPPVQEADENVCWPLTGSGEIDIFEHHSDGGPDHYVSRMIKSLGYCDGGDWKSMMQVMDAKLDDYHEYSVEWQKNDLIYRLDGVEVYRNAGQGNQFPEPMFAILNFAKINDSPMDAEWVMEVDWVKHEYWEE